MMYIGWDMWSYQSWIGFLLLFVFYFSPFIKSDLHFYNFIFIIYFLQTFGCSPPTFFMLHRYSVAVSIQVQKCTQTSFDVHYINFILSGTINFDM